MYFQWYHSFLNQKLCKRVLTELDITLRYIPHKTKVLWSPMDLMSTIAATRLENFKKYYSFTDPGWFFAREFTIVSNGTKVDVVSHWYDVLSFLRDLVLDEKKTIAVVI